MGGVAGGGQIPLLSSGSFSKCHFFSAFPFARVLCSVLFAASPFELSKNILQFFTKFLRLFVADRAGTHLGGGVYPDCCVEEDVVAQLLEQRRSVRQTIQVLGKGQELLQHGPGDVDSRRLGERRQTSAAVCPG